jgi:hypothetical protein
MAYLRHRQRAIWKEVCLAVHEVIAQSHEEIEHIVFTRRDIELLAVKPASRNRMINRLAQPSLTAETSLFDLGAIFYGGFESSRAWAKYAPVRRGYW